MSTCDTGLVTDLFWDVVFVKLNEFLEEEWVCEDLFGCCPVWFLLQQQAHGSDHHLHQVRGTGVHSDTHRHHGWRFNFKQAGGGAKLI